jgi:hypothetical protein
MQKLHGSTAASLRENIEDQAVFDLIACQSRLVKDAKLHRTHVTQSL